MRLPFDKARRTWSLIVVYETLAPLLLRPASWGPESHCSSEARCASVVTAAARLKKTQRGRQSPEVDRLHLDSPETLMSGVKEN